MSIPTSKHAIKRETLAPDEVEALKKSVTDTVKIFCNSKLNQAAVKAEVHANTLRNVISTGTATPKIIQKIRKNLLNANSSI